MGFGGEVQDRPNPMAGQEIGRQFPVAYIPPDQQVSLRMRQAFKITGVAGIGQKVEIDDRFIFGRVPVQYEIGAYEPGSAGYQDGHSKITGRRRRL